jgi:serine-type D-Ala-D-Ala carboxypeptidase (penicillin-binding protein 5/6)
MTRRLIILIVLAICLTVLLPVLIFALVGAHSFNELLVAAPTPTPTIPPPTPTPTPLPTPILTAVGNPPTISASAAYLLDEDTGNTLADINGEEPLPMASTTKIMTAIIAIQAGDLNSLVVIHQDAVDEVIFNQGSSAQLIVGDRIRLVDLLYALLVPSGDDAAIAIADAVGGTEQNFVRIMNITALRLHLYQTHYANPDGLPAPDHYSSAYDLARLAHYAMTIPLFVQIVQTQEYMLPENGLHHGYVWKTTNTLLGTYKGATGIKTGTTPEAGYCLVFSATRNGHHLIGVVLHSTSEQRRFADAKALLDWGFGLPLLIPTS